MELDDALARLAEAARIRTLKLAISRVEQRNNEETVLSTPTTGLMSCVMGAGTSVPRHPHLSVQEKQRISEDVMPKSFTGKLGIVPALDIESHERLEVVVKATSGR